MIDFWYACIVICIADIIIVIGMCRATVSVGIGQMLKCVSTLCTILVYCETIDIKYDTLSNQDLLCEVPPVTHVIMCIYVDNYIIIRIYRMLYTNVLTFEQA